MPGGLNVRTSRRSSLSRRGRSAYGVTGTAALAGLLPQLRPFAEQLLTYATSRVYVSSVRRSTALQAQIYAQFRRDLARGTAKYPVAPPGTSLHEVGRAFDLDASPAELRHLASIWKGWGGRWGGDFKHTLPDPIHFEA